MQTADCCEDILALKTHVNLLELKNIASQSKIDTMREEQRKADELLKTSQTCILQLQEAKNTMQKMFEAEQNLSKVLRLQSMETRQAQTFELGRRMKAEDALGTVLHILKSPYNNSICNM